MTDSPRIHDLRRRIQEDPASLAFAPLAEELRRAGRADEAVTVCHAGLDLHPEYLSARATLGRALLDLGRLEEAFVELTAVLRAAPEHLSALRGVADVHYRRGEVAEALETSRTALALVRHDVDLERLIAELERRVPVSPRAPGAASNAPVPDRIPSGDRQRAILGGLEQFLMAVLTDRARRASLGRS